MIFFIFFVIVILVFFARYNFFRMPRKGIVVLLYHRVDDRPSFTSLDKFSIPLRKFEWQIRFLKARGFKSISPDHVEEVINRKLYLKHRYVLITFDDGYKDNLVAAKILKDYGFRGLFFVSTAFIGKTYNGVEMLAEEDLKKLVNMGMFLGSHSHDHVKLAELEESDIELQIGNSISILSKYQRIEDFAYPFGNYDPKVEGVLHRFGIKRAYVIGQKIFDSTVESNFRIPRSVVRKDTNKIDFHLIITRGRGKF